MLKTALITGAGSGLGRGFAFALARRGFHLLLAGRDVARLQAVAGEVASLTTASTYCVDLSDPLACSQLVDSVIACDGIPTLLVNNAATMLPGSFVQHTTSEIDTAFSVNLLAPAKLTRHFCSAPNPPRGIIFVLSTAARFPQPYNSLYCASKTGLRALAEALQVELSGQTRICLAYPPLTATPMTEPFGAGRWPVKKAAPLPVAERIISAYESGQDEITWFDWEIFPNFFYRLAPHLFRRILKTQRLAFRGLFTRSKPHSR